MKRGSQTMAGAEIYPWIACAEAGSSLRAVLFGLNKFLTAL